MWILSQNSPNLTVAGKVLTIYKHCPTRVNAATACTSKKNLSIISPITYGGLAVGLFIGAFGASTVATVVALL